MIEYGRDYQAEAHAAILRDLEEVQFTSAVWATGLGKTRLASGVISARQPGRALFLAHKRKLVHQAAKEITRWTGLECDVEMGDERAARHDWFKKCPVVVTSVQTQYAGKGSRLFDPKDFSTLIIDELHHFIGTPAFQGVVEHYMRGNPNLKIIGLTATPKRTDEAALGRLVQRVSHVYEIQPAVRDGWLVYPRQQFVPVSGLDYSHVRATAGRLSESDLAAVLEAEEIEQGMIQPILELSWGVPRYSLKTLPVDQWGEFLRSHGKPRQSVIFCASIKQAETFSNIINRAVPETAKSICEKTPEEEREKIYRDFASGKIHHVANVDILGEGYDNPSIEFVFMATITNSLIRYTQRIGRGTRTLPGVIDGKLTVQERLAAIAASAKPILSVIDFAGNSGKHKLISTVDILGGNYSDEAQERAVKKAKDKDELVDMVALLNEAEAELLKEAADRKRQEEARKARVVAKSNYSTREVDPFDIYQVAPTRARAWDTGKQLSLRQREVLKSDGLNPDAYDYPTAKQLIDLHFARKERGLCSFKAAVKLKKAGQNPDVPEQVAASQLGVTQMLSSKQLFRLRQAGYNPETLTLSEARNLVGLLAANGWRRLPDNPPQPQEDPTEAVPF